MTDDIISKILGAVVAIVTGGFFWLVRTVFTNSREISILRTKLDNQEETLKDIHKNQEKVYDLVYEHFKSK